MVPEVKHGALLLGHAAGLYVEFVSLKSPDIMRQNAYHRNHSTLDIILEPRDFQNG